MSQKSTESKHGGGPRKADIASLARNVFWYWAVRHRTRLSDEELDQKFILKDPLTGNEREIGRPRTFYSIRHRGADPGKILNKHGVNLVDVVARELGLEDTREAYESLTWRLFQPPMPTDVEVKSIIDTLLKAEGLYRASDENMVLGKMFLENKEPFRYGFEEAYRTDLMKEITSQGTLNGLGLIGALAREAAMAFDFHHAEVFHTEFEFCLMRVSFNYGLDVELEKLIGGLAFYRVFSNRWETVPNDRTRKIAMKNLNAKRKIQGLAPAKIGDFEVEALALRYHNDSADHMHRIVKRTKEIEWLIQNHQELLAKLDEFELTHPRVPGPYPFTSAKEFVEAEMDIPADGESRDATQTVRHDNV